MTIKNYKIGLKKNRANYAPLSPVSFLERAALVFPDYISIISENKRFTWRETFKRCQLFASSLKKKKIKKIKSKKKEPDFYGLGRLNYMIFKFLCARFRL